MFHLLKDSSISGRITATESRRFEGSPRIIEVRPADRSFVRSIDRSIGRRATAKNRLLETRPRERRLRAIIVRWRLLVLTKLLLLGRRDSDRVKVSACAHVSSDFLGCYASPCSCSCCSSNGSSKSSRATTAAAAAAAAATNASSPADRGRSSADRAKIAARALERVISCLKPR